MKNELNDNKINSLNGQLDKKSKRIETLKLNLNNEKTIITNLRKRIKDKIHKIKDLTTKCSNYRKQVLEIERLYRDRELSKQSSKSFVH